MASRRLMRHRKLLRYRGIHGNLFSGSKSLTEYDVPPWRSAFSTLVAWLEPFRNETPLSACVANQAIEHAAMCRQGHRQCTRQAEILVLPKITQSVAAFLANPKSPPFVAGERP